MWVTSSSNSNFSAEGYFDRSLNGSELWIIALKARFELIDEEPFPKFDKPPVVSFGPDYVEDDLEGERNEEEIPSEDIDFDNDDFEHEYNAHETLEQELDDGYSDEDDDDDEEDDANTDEPIGEGDFAAFRQATDIHVRGEVEMPPNGQERLLSFSFGSLNKRGVVRQPRLGMVDGVRIRFRDLPFMSYIPLSWTYAYGGPELGRPGGPEYPFNTLGCGHAPGTLMSLPLGTWVRYPCFSYEGETFSALSGPIRPFGFGMIQRHWRQRARYAGTYDKKWQEERAPLFAKDLNPKFFQCAPTDQVYPGYLKGGEEVHLTGFNIKRQMKFRVPQILATAVTVRGTEEVASDFRCIAVHLYPNENAFEMVWNSTVPCNGQDHLIKESRVTIKQMAGVEV